MMRAVAADRDVEGSGLERQVFSRELPGLQIAEAAPGGLLGDQSEHRLGKIAGDHFRHERGKAIGRVAAAATDIESDRSRSLCPTRRAISSRSSPAA